MRAAHDPYYSAPMPFVFLGSGEPPCQYHNAIFPSTGLEYFILECLGPGIPTVALYKTEMPAPRLIAVLQNNTLLRVSFRRSCKVPPREMTSSGTFINFCHFFFLFCFVLHQAVRHADFVICVAGEAGEHCASAGKDVSRAYKRWLQCPSEIAPSPWTERGRNHALSVGRPGVSMSRVQYSLSSSLLLLLLQTISVDSEKNLTLACVHFARTSAYKVKLLLTGMVRPARN